jgi:hypothetical protein
LNRCISVKYSVIQYSVFFCSKYISIQIGQYMKNIPRIPYTRFQCIKPVIVILTTMQKLKACICSSRFYYQRSVYKILRILYKGYIYHISRITRTTSQDICICKYKAFIPIGKANISCKLFLKNYTYRFGGLHRQ